MDSPGAAVSHVVTKSESSGTSITVTRTASVELAEPSETASVKVTVVSASTGGAANVATGEEALNVISVDES